MKPFAVVLLGAMLVACAPAPLPSASPSPAATSPGVSTPSATSPTPSPTPTPSVSLPTSTPTETVVCVRQVAPLPAALAGDPCPSAVAAVRALVEPLGHPIVKIYVTPGHFPCGGLWPGVGSPTVCLGVLELPGRTMHGWVAFFGTDKVAAVTLARDIPAEGATPPPAPTWKATLAAFIVPPAGWSMP